MLQKGSEDLYRLLVDGAKDYAIFALDPNGIISSWNTGARNIKGYTAEEVIGRHFSIFYPEEDIRNGKPELELRIATETGSYEDEGWRLRKDGSRFWANVIITALRDKTGKLLGFGKVTRDLTERRNTELALSRIKDELEDTVEKLRLSVKTLNEEISLRKETEEDLMEKNHLLEVSNSDLEQFAYAASHDMKEPLRMIGNFTTLLVNRCQCEDEESKMYTGFILDGVTHLQALINGLLDYSRIGQSEAGFAPVYTAELLKMVKRSLSSEIEDTQASIQQCELPVILGVPSLISTLFQNLIANAIKFRRPDVPPRVEICARKEEDLWLFTIADNGIGIPKEYHDRIFIIFQRLHTRQDYEGTGIGLSICKRIVDFHGGSLWLESEEGKGTTFFFTLPATDQ